jgi:hypothetical protein
VNVRHIIEAVVGADSEELDKIIRIIKTTAIQLQDQPNKIEAELNRLLKPYHIRFDANNAQLRSAHAPGMVGPDGTVIIATPPVSHLRGPALPFMRELISHELVHNRQRANAEKRKPGSAALIYQNFMAKVHPKGPGTPIDLDAYGKDKAELMAFARSCVDRMVAGGMPKGAIISQLRAGLGINFPFRPKDPKDRRRKLKYALAYAQQLGESV